MDGIRFDQVVRRLSSSFGRRAVLRTLVAGIGAVALTRIVADEAAACRAEGQECRTGAQCCSGICRKRGNKKRCRPAEFQGTCRAGQAFCQPGFGGCNGVEHCSCAQSLTGELMCADVMPCWPCAQDSDCVELVGPNAICGRPIGSQCANACVGVAGSNGTFCARPCGT